MPTFPLTFPHAGRTFGVVADTVAEHAGDDANGRTVGTSAVVFVRVVGTRGLHELGPVVPDETNAELTARVCRWYDDVYRRSTDGASRDSTPA